MKKQVKELSTKILLFLIAALIGIVCVFPIYWMFVSSFRPQKDLFSTTIELLPYTFSFEHYDYAFKAAPMFRVIGNTTFVATTRTLLSLFLCSLAGFAFSKLRFPGRRGLFVLLLFTMTVPYEALIIPSFIIFIKLGWVDTYYPLIIPMAASAFGIFLMRQYINTVPEELVQAARIDGCGYFRIYTAIILPVIKPVLVTLAIFIFKLAWNDFLWPLIIIRKMKNQLLMVVIRTLPPIESAMRDIPWGATMAAASLSVIPLLVLFVIMRRQFISGATQGAIK